jgi:hypothetical protein
MGSPPDCQGIATAHALHKRARNVFFQSSAVERLLKYNVYVTDRHHLSLSLCKDVRMTSECILLVVTVPVSHLYDVLSAMAEAGAGVIGEYTHCAYYAPGTGRFRPGENANPTIGTRTEITEVDEYRIEAQCPRSSAKAVCQAIRAAHPYEEPVFYLIPLLEEDEL